VFCAVVFEHATKLAQARDEDEIAEEDGGAQHPFDEPEERRGVQRALDQADDADR